MVRTQGTFSAIRASGAAALLLTTGSQLPQTPVPNASPLVEDGPVEILDLMDERYDRMTVDVSIAGHGPFPFIVDTGAQRTLISKELAGSLGLTEGREAELHSMSGLDTVSTFIIPTLNVTTRPVKDIHAPAIARMHLGAAGILGVDSLVSQRVLLDFKQRRMTISPSAEREQKWDSDTIVVKAKSRFGQLVLVDARADGERVNVIIDTGAQVSIGNEALRRKLLGKNPKRKPVPVELISVTGGRTVADYTWVDNLKIGGVTMTNMPIAFADVHPFRKLGLIDKPAMLLGIDSLKLFERVSLDFANRKVRFLLPDSAEATDARQVAALN